MESATSELAETAPPLSPAPAPKRRLALAATFTAEPLTEALAFWMEELDLPLEISFAPYHQVFQQVLDGGSLLRQNRDGINVLLVRFQDWRTGSETELHSNLEDLSAGLRGAGWRRCLVCLCPDGPGGLDDSGWAAARQRLAALIGDLPGLDLMVMPAAPGCYDAEADRLGHIPYTDAFFAELGTALMRRIHALEAPPYKVIVLDCDNTLWRGGVGEDGVAGLEFPPGLLGLQAFMVEQQRAGMLLCLCSKNEEHDVLEVFRRRPEMHLTLDHLAAWKINWQAKSENLQALARELNLGLDSMIFIDDSPVECAAVRSACPDVLTLELPAAPDPVDFLHRVWALDHGPTSREDAERTRKYQENAARQHSQKEAGSFSDFLDSLELSVEIQPASAEQVLRIAQLSQRTNQFNATTTRYSPADIHHLLKAGSCCDTVTVRDRFGDYGLVGVMVYRTVTGEAQVDTFLLSCRVLGRGVEHQMLAHLGRFAQSHGLTGIRIRYIETPRNRPLLDFLETLPGRTGVDFSLSTAQALDARFIPHEAPETRPDLDPPTREEARPGRAQRLRRIALELYDPSTRQAAMRSKTRPPSPPAEHPPYTLTEQALADYWTELLQVESVGPTDNYFELGGTSLKAVRLFAWIERTFGRALPLTTLVDVPTVETLARVLDLRPERASRPARIKLHDGTAFPPLFLLHDADGETLLYRTLARHVQPSRPMYGIQPLSQDGHAILHTRIPDMVEFYVQVIQAIQASGPYLLGGLCAGGVLAFEVACALQAQGQPVALVALMDAADARAVRRVGHVANQRLTRFTQALGASEASTGRRIRHILSTAGRKITNLLLFESRSRVKTHRERTQVRLLRRALDQGQPVPPGTRGLTVRAVYSQAEAEFHPTRRFEGDVLLFRATTGEGKDEPLVRKYEDTLLGWGRRVTGQVHMWDVPGGHSTMLQEPHVRAIAEQLRRWIDASV